MPMVTPAFSAMGAGVGHADRTHGPRLGLGEQGQERGVRHVAAAPPGGPGDVVDMVVHGERHQGVIGGMEPRLVDAPAVAVELNQLRRIAIGGLAQLQHRLGPHHRAQRRQRRAHPFAAFAQGRVPQRRVGLEQIAAGELGRLVEDLVGLQLGGGRETGHDPGLLRRVPAPAGW